MENKIYEVIRQRNYTQGEVAEKVGIRREYINRIIQKKIIPSVPLGIRIAKALETTVEELFILDK